MRRLLHRLQTQNRIAIQLAIISFIAGFIVFLLFVITGNKEYAFLGIICIIIASIFNLILFLVVVGHTILGSVSLKEGLFTMYVMILNIPITISYFHINYEILVLTLA
ncbi:MAG: hypothetical protein ABF274_10380 [Nonlabens sp.]|uniref:hypothetical protein n=1 Tax=Nonlabens sp. TaxID=1888209 RepID=UPI00321972FC